MLFAAWDTYLNTVCPVFSTLLQTPLFKTFQDIKLNSITFLVHIFVTQGCSNNEAAKGSDETETVRGVPPFFK